LLDYADAHGVALTAEGQSENRDACVRPPGACYCVNAAHRKMPRKMKVAEPIDIECLQAERLQDFFAFQVRRPIREVIEVSGHNWRVRYGKLFCGVSRNRSCERN